MVYSRKRILFGLTALLMLVLAGCSGKKRPQDPPVQEEMVETETEYVPERPIWQVMGSEAQDWAEQFDPEKVESLTYEILGESREEYTLVDSQAILSYFNALDQITVSEKAEGYASDAGDIFHFKMKDGSQVTVEFCLSCFSMDRSLYETQNAEELWDLTSQLINADDQPEQEE